MNYWMDVFLTSGSYDTVLKHKPEELDEPCLASQTCPNRQINSFLMQMIYT